MDHQNPGSVTAGFQPLSGVFASTQTSMRCCISSTQAFTSNLAPSCEQMLNSNYLLLPMPSKSSVGLTTVLAFASTSSRRCSGSTSSLPMTIRADDARHASLNTADTQIQPANHHHARTSKWLRSRTQPRQPHQDKGPRNSEKQGAHGLGLANVALEKSEKCFNSKNPPQIHSADFAAQLFCALLRS